MKKITILITVMFFAFIVNAQQPWAQIGQDIDGESAGDNSGNSVSMSSDGSIVAIGAESNDGNGSDAGQVRIYENISGTWTQIGQDIDGENAGDNSGISVSLSSDGSIVAIGANYNDDGASNAGHVRIYENISGTWTQIGQDIDGEDSSENLGQSVSLSSDGTIVAIGAPRNNDNGTSAGAVRIYENISGTWTQIGQNINGEAAYDYAGWSVSISSDGSIVAFGSFNNDNNGSNAGNVRVYENISGTWTQIGQDINGEAAGDYSGHSMSLSSDGTIVAIGAESNDDNGTSSGHVRVYRNIAGTWNQIGQDIDGEAANDYSGEAVSLSSDGSTVAIGAYKNDGHGTNSGHVRVYKNISDTWVKIEQDINGEAAGDYSGKSVSLSSDGSTVAIGAILNGGNGSDAGQVRVYYYNCGNASTLVETACSSYTSPSGIVLENSGTYVDTIPNAAGCDSVITIHLTIANSNTGIDTQTACESFDWIDGNTYTANNNTATDTLTNVEGCDSVVTLNLTVTNIDNTVSQNSVTLTANASGYSYQWIDCDNGNTPINNETNQSFTATVNGNYAVEITDGSCINTSDCISVTVMGVNNISNIGVSLMPNPVTDILQIKANHEIHNILLMDNSGKIIKEYSVNNSNYKIDMSNLNTGIYFIKIETSKSVYVNKVIKQ